MTTKPSPTTLSDAPQRVESLIKLVQDKSQLGSFSPGNVWWVVNHNAKSKKRLPGSVSLIEQVDCSPQDFDAAYTRKLVEGLRKNHRYLHFEVASNCNVVTVLDMDERGNPIPVPGGAPDSSDILTDTNATRIMKRRVLDSLAVPEKVASTPVVARNKAKRPVLSVTPLPGGFGAMVPTPKRPRQEEKTTGINKSVDIDVHINVLVDEHSIDLESLASTVVGRLLDKARVSGFEPSFEMQTLAYLVMKRCTDKEGIITLNRLDTLDRKCGKQYIAIPESRKKVLELEDKRVIKKKAKALLHVLGEQSDQQDAILMEIAKENGYKIFRKEKAELTVTEVIALRDFSLTSQNGVRRIDQFLRHRLDLSIFPSNFMRRVVEYESKNDTSLAIMQIPLYMSKKEVNKKYCTFFHVKDPFAVLESLVIRAISDGSFEESFTFSSLRDKLVVVFGGDRGGEAFSMLIRVANRAKGNASRYCQLLALFEDGAECYENIRDSILSLLFPVRNFLQLLLDDKLLAIVVTIETEDGQKECTCVVVQLSDLGREEAESQICNLIQSIKYMSTVPCVWDTVLSFSKPLLSTHFQHNTNAAMVAVSKNVGVSVDVFSTMALVHFVQDTCNFGKGV